MSKKKTTEEFKQEVLDLVGNEYTVLEEYVNNKTGLKIRHNRCKNEYHVTPNEFLSGNRCPFCSKRKRKNIKIFKQEVFDLVGDEYTVLGKYENSQTKIKIRHNICGNEFLMKPNSFQQGQRCPICAKQRMIKRNIQYRESTESYKNKLKIMTNNTITFIDEYKNCMTETLHKCNICGHIWKIRPNNIQQGHRCPKCNGNKSTIKNTEKYIQEVFDLIGDEYTVLGEYINNHTKILMKHNKCNNEYYVRPTNFLQGQRCPICKRSKGEEIITSLLDEWGYKYETQVSFPDCKYKLPLRFDFKIFLNEDKFILLEYNGKQHYEKLSYIYQEYFEDQQIRDNIKNEYCKNKKISFYIIRYDEDLEKRLKEILDRKE